MDIDVPQDKDNAATTRRFLHIPYEGLSRTSYSIKPQDTIPSLIAHFCGIPSLHAPALPLRRDLQINFSFSPPSASYNDFAFCGMTLLELIGGSLLDFQVPRSDEILTD